MQHVLHISLQQQQMHSTAGKPTIDKTTISTSSLMYGETLNGFSKFKCNIPPKKFSTADQKFQSWNFFFFNHEQYTCHFLRTQKNVYRILCENLYFFFFKQFSNIEKIRKHVVLNRYKCVFNFSTKEGRHWTFSIDSQLKN